MNTEHMIEITGTDLSVFVRKVYDLSRPQGLGFMHFKPEPLSDEDLQKVLAQGRPDIRPVQMDYVNGRACKMTVWKFENKLFINDRWYDHTESEHEELLTVCTVVPKG